MSAQPIPLFDILEEIPEPKRLRTPRQSWFQDLQSTGLIAFETPWDVHIPRAAPVEIDLVGQVFFQPHSVRDYVESPGAESSIVTGAIDALLADLEDEVVPTHYAYEKARSLIEAAYGEINRRRVKKPWGVPEIFPKPFVTTDDVGGIRLAWRTEARQVRANFGATSQLRSYIYFESGFEHGVEPLDSQHLAGRLTWLTGR